MEQKINYVLNNFPVIKKIIKRLYQYLMYLISPKIKSEGAIVRVSPDDDMEYFFGYYDKSPWDISGRFMLCMRAKKTWRDPSPKDKAEIILIDTKNKNCVKKIADTRAWNVQQACMLQWLGPDFESKIIYNDYREGRYVAVILEIGTGKEKVINAPIYSVSRDGLTALTLDFSRLYNLRPGYGYYNVEEKTKNVSLPNENCIWRVLLDKGEVMPVLKYTDFADFQPRKEMQNGHAVHKVNHIMLSPNGKRFMVLYRWFVGSRKYTRLITCNIDGSDMYLLADDDMISHCYWKNDLEIIAYRNKRGEGTGYYLMKDCTREETHLWKKIDNDGHPSYSPTETDRVVFDSYPNRARIADIKVISDEDIEAIDMEVIARVFAPFKYDNDTRCDLHPRWSRDGKMICFDSVHEGHRGLYVVSVPQVKK